MWSDAIDTIEYRGYKVKLYQEFEPWDPREWDNLGRMLCAHKRYRLGDPLDIAAPGWSEYWADRFSGWGEVRRAIWRDFDAVVVIPLYMYDHSGITIRTYPFASHWDSGKIGYIWASRKDVMECYSRERMSDKLRDRVEKVLVGEVETYDQYVTNDVYGWVVESPEGRSLDSCSGYFGWDYARNAMLQEARSVIDWDIKHRIQDHADRVKVWIKNNVPFQYRQSLDLPAVALAQEV